MQKKNDKNGRKNATKQTLTKENSQKEQTQSLQSISFDGEERQRLARQDRKIYLSGLETRRQTSCATQFGFKMVITDLLIALFSNADLSTRIGGLLWYLS